MSKRTSYQCLHQVKMLPSRNFMSSNAKIGGSKDERTSQKLNCEPKLCCYGRNLEGMYSTLDVSFECPVASEVPYQGFVDLPVQNEYDVTPACCYCHLDSCTSPRLYGVLWNMEWFIWGHFTDESLSLNSISSCNDSFESMHL